MDEIEFASDSNLAPFAPGQAVSDTEKRAFNRSLLAILWTLPLDENIEQSFVIVEPYKQTISEAWKIYISAGALSLSTRGRDDWEETKMDIDREPGTVPARLATLIDTAWQRGIKSLHVSCKPAKDMPTAHELLRYAVEAAKWDPK
jgi:hypothetical protein